MSEVSASTVRWEGTRASVRGERLAARSFRAPRGTCDAPRVVGGAQLPCEAFVLAIVAEDPVEGEEGAAPEWRSHFLIVSDGFVVKARSNVLEDEVRQLGNQIVDVCTGRRTELSFRSSSGHLYVSLVRRPRGEIGVAGHLVRDETGLLSAFQTRTDLPSLESFGDALRAFPYA